MLIANKNLQYMRYIMLITSYNTAIKRYIWLRVATDMYTFY